MTGTLDNPLLVFGVSPVSAADMAAAAAASVPASLPGGGGTIDDCYLAETQALSGSASAAPSWLSEPLGVDPIAVDVTRYSPVVVSPLYWSDRGFTTAPSDNPANVHYESRLSDPLRIERSIPLTPESPRRASRQLGALKIDNADGALDAVPDLAVDARPVSIKRGLRTAAYSGFSTVFAGLGVGFVRSASSLTFEIRGRDYLLDVPLQPNLYLGTGGAEGGSDLKGKPKPLLFGLCRDVSAVPLVNASLIYQIHDGAVFAIDAVYDRAQALTFDADYASYAALAAASIPAGRYATSLATGLIRLGGTPVGIVTADVRGDAPAVGGGYTANAAQIARRLLLTRGAQSTADLDETGIAATAFKVPATCGYFFTEPVSVAAAVEAVCGGAYLWFGTLRSGAFTIRRFAAPTAAKYEIAAADIVGAVDELTLPDSVRPCNWRRRVGYRRCWTVQTGTEIDNASLAAARRAFVGEPYRAANSALAARQIKNILATDPPVLPSSMDSENDALALADNLLELFAPGRILLRVPVRLPVDLDLDDCVRLVYPRFGLSAGRLFRIYGIDERHGDRRADLLLFG